MAPAGSLLASGSQATHQERCCYGASSLGSQGTCSGPAAGSGDAKPRLGAVLPLMVSAGHTHTHVDTPPTHIQTQRQVAHAYLDQPLPLRTQKGTEAQSGGQAPPVAISQLRDPRCPSEQTSAPPLFTNWLNRKQKAQPS